MLMGTNPAEQNRDDLTVHGESATSEQKKSPSFDEDDSLLITYLNPNNLKIRCIKLSSSIGLKPLLGLP